MPCRLTVLISNHLPKLGTNLVTALTGLNVNNLSHILMWLQINLSIICAARSTKSWSLLISTSHEKKRPYLEETRNCTYFGVCSCALLRIMHHTECWYYSKHTSSMNEIGFDGYNLFWKQLFIVF